MKQGKMRTENRMVNLNRSPAAVLGTTRLTLAEGWRRSASRCVALYVLGSGTDLHAAPVVKLFNAPRARNDGDTQQGIRRPLRCARVLCTPALNDDYGGPSLTWAEFACPDSSFDESEFPADDLL